MLPRFIVASCARAAQVSLTVPAMSVPRPSNETLCPPSESDQSVRDVPSVRPSDPVAVRLAEDIGRERESRAIATANGAKAKSFTDNNLRRRGVPRSSHGIY